MEERIKALEEQLGTALDAVDRLQGEVADLKENLTAKIENVSSISLKPEAPKVLPKDPGAVKIGEKKYSFTSIVFKANLYGSVNRYTAEEVAKDAKLCEKLLAEYPSLFTEVKGK